jgi:hypothetical protein
MERPITLARSNPRAQAEANATDSIAIDSTFRTVTFHGVTYVVPQLKSAMLWLAPSIGDIAWRVSGIGEGKFAAAAFEVADAVGFDGVKLTKLLQQVRDAACQPECLRNQASRGRVWRSFGWRGNRAFYDADVRRS